MALQFVHSQQNPPRSRVLLALPCCQTCHAAASPSEGLLLPVPHPALQSCVSPLPTLGSSLPGLSTSSLPSSKPGSFQTIWLCYIHLFTGTCQSLLFSSIPFLPGEAKVTQPRDLSSDMLISSFLLPWPGLRSTHPPVIHALHS